MKHKVKQHVGKRRGAFVWNHTTQEPSAQVQHSTLVLVANYAASPRVRRVVENGRNYLVAPLTLIVPGVLSGSKGALFYPPDEVARNVGAWNGMPLVLGHPTRMGDNLAFNDLTDNERYATVMGEVRNAHVNKQGRLRAEGWFEEEATQRISNQVHHALTNHLPIELSTGLYTENERAPLGSVFNGVAGPREYHYIARNYRPDHLAILINQIGACSIQDGCGVTVNTRQAQQREATMSKNNLFARFMNWLASDTESLRVANNADNLPLTNEDDEDDDEERAENASRCPDCGGRMVDGECEDCGYDERTDNAECNCAQCQARNATPNQPRHAERGIYLPHGAGTGKGPVHASATEGHNKGREKEGTPVSPVPLPTVPSAEDIDPDAQETTPSKPGDPNVTVKNKKAVKDMSRAELVSGLAANCKCDKEKVALNHLTTETLAQLFLAKNAKLDEVSTGGKPTKERFVQVGGEEDESVDKFTDEDQVGIEREKKMAMNKLTPEEWFALMPEQAKPIWNAAAQVERQGRFERAKKLVAHIQDPEKRQLVGNELMKKPINELDFMLSLQPKYPTRNQETEVSETQFNFAGAGAPVANNGTTVNSADDDVLPLPTMNWKEAM